jgi:hypothetical protein
MPVRVKLILLCTVFFFSAELRAIPSRPFSVGFGFGVPELAFVEAQVMAFGRCQIGASFSYAPPALMPKDVPLPEQTVTLSTGDVFTYEPLVTPSFYMISPFLRFFPNTQNNFYLQFLFSVFRATATIRGDMTPRDNAILPSVPVTGTVSLTQTIPNFSVGYLFSTRIYYFNLNIGAAYLRPASTTTSVSALVPDSLGGSAGNEVQLDGINDDIQQSINDSSTTVRTTYGIFPTIHLSMGFYF